jgi:hypothetical protein
VRATLLIESRARIGDVPAQPLDQLAAHRLLDQGTQNRNDTLADDYRRWNPDFTHTTDQEHLAA